MEAHGKNRNKTQRWKIVSELASGYMLNIRREGRLIKTSVKLPDGIRQSDEYGFYVEVDFTAAHDELFQIGAQKQDAQLPEEFWELVNQIKSETPRARQSVSSSI